MIDRLVRSIVWVVFAVIVGLVAWSLIDPASDSEKRSDLLKFLGFIWLGFFAIFCIGPAINNYRYGDLVKQTPVTQILKQSAFRASLFIIFLYFYLMIRGGPNLI